MAKEPREASSMVSLEMRGTWKSSMWRGSCRRHSPASLCGARSGSKLVIGLLGVQLDDELFLHGRRDLAALRGAQHLRGERVVVGLQPGRNLCGQLGGIANRGLGAPARLDRDDVALPHLVAGDVDPPAIDRPMTVADELAGLPPRGGEPEPPEHVVQPALEEREQVLARDARLARSLVVIDAELLLEDAVVPARLLLLAQLDPVLRLLLAPATVVAGRVGPALDAALVRQAALALEEELLAFAA